MAERETRQQVGIACFNSPQQFMLSDKTRPLSPPSNTCWIMIAVEVVPLIAVFLTTAHY